MSRCLRSADRCQTTRGLSHRLCRTVLDHRVWVPRCELFEPQDGIWIRGPDGDYHATCDTTAFDYAERAFAWLLRVYPGRLNQAWVETCPAGERACS